MNFDNAKYQPNSRIHIFYYGWYGTPEVNEEYMHWNHEVGGGVVVFWCNLLCVNCFLSGLEIFE